MKICRTVAEMRSAVAGLRAKGDTIGLVTTMGALHPGHLALVEAAQADHPSVVATIFVNPTQFGNPADLAAYPRTEDADLALLRRAGVAAVLIPGADEIYPEGDETIVETTHLANVLHGLVRPGHFRGVATVVTKLFNIVQPDAAYFGEKDYQQLAVIRRMVRDLHMPIAIHGVPTVREADGLAMSSRNVRLSPEDRVAATVLHRALDRAEGLAAQGSSAEALKALIEATFATEPRATLRGVDIVRAGTLAPINGMLTGKVAILLSAEFGPPGNPVLLIDQREIGK